MTSSDQSSETSISSSIVDKATNRNSTYLYPSFAPTFSPQNKEEYDTASQPDCTYSYDTAISRAGRSRA